MYNAHKCRDHKNASDYDVAVVVQDLLNIPQDGDTERDPTEVSNETETASVAGCSTEGITEQLQHNLAAFFLKLQTILHVSQRATQEIIEHIEQLFSLSEPVVTESVIKVLKNVIAPLLTHL